MKILHTIPHVGRISAGPSLSVLNLCKSLSSSCKVVLASTDSRNSVIKYPFIKTFPVTLKLSKLDFSLSMYAWLKQSLKQKNFDIVHNHSLWLLQNLYPSWAAYKFNTPIIISPRGTLAKAALRSGSKFKKIFWIVLQRPALKKATFFHATSNSEMHDIRRLGFTQPVIVIPNGLQVPSLTRTALPNSVKRKKLLFLGRIHPIKGLRNLIQAWSIFENEHGDWDLEIVGPDSYNHLKKLKILVNKLAIKRITFSSEVSGNLKTNKFVSSDLFILPSYSENFGMVIAEALSYGVPCIASRGTPWENLHINNAGWWTSNDTDSILQALREASMKSKEELDQMGRNGRRWIMEDFSLKKNALKWNQVYTWILTKKNKPEFIYDK